METKRLIIRSLEEADAIDLFEIYGDPDVVLGNSMDPLLYDVEEVLRYLRQEMNPPKGYGISTTYAIEHKEKGKVIGTIVLLPIVQDNVEIGYFLNRRYWRNGYMKEALRAFLSTLDVHRIEVQIDPSNIASQRLADTLGFTYEGTLQQALRLNDGRYHDLCVYAYITNQNTKEEAK